MSDETKEGGGVVIPFKPREMSEDQGRRPNGPFKDNVVQFPVRQDITPPEPDTIKTEPDLTETVNYMAAQVVAGFIGPSVALRDVALSKRDLEIYTATILSVLGVIDDNLEEHPVTKSRVDDIVDDLTTDEISNITSQVKKVIRMNRRNNRP